MSPQPCPHCGTPLEIADPALGIGHCTSCAQVIELAPLKPYQGTQGTLLLNAYTIEVVPEPSYLAKARRALEVPREPPGLKQTVENGVIQLELPWASNTETNILLFVGMFAILPLLSLKGSFFSLIPAACAGYYLVHVFVNRTTLRLTPDAIEIEHGPLPNLHTSRSLPLHELEGLQVQKWTSISRRMGFVLYNLRTRHRTLLEHWTDGEVLHHVKTCIEIQRARSGS